MIPTPKILIIGILLIFIPTEPLVTFQIKFVSVFLLITFKVELFLIQVLLFILILISSFILLLNFFILALKSIFITLYFINFIF